MYCRFLFLIFVAVFNTVKTEEFTYSSGRNELKMCIEDCLLKDLRLDIGKASTDIAEMVAKRFSYKSFTRNQLYKASSDLIYRIRDKKSELFRDRPDGQVAKQLRTSIRNALEYCVERYNLPRFANEPQILADLLDFMLVDWPTPVNAMILTHEGRSTLRLYAYSAGVRLMSALRYFSMDFDVFHRELFRIWMCRAQQFYDGRGEGFPYIRHRFTTDRDRIFSSTSLTDIHTIDDVNSFTSRRLQNFTSRNPALGLQNVNEVLNILESSYQLNDSFRSPLSRISSAENYLETHMHRCYRIIMYILELQIRGINTNEDDVYNETISNDFMPLSIQKIVWDDVAYRNYLTAWREHIGIFSSKGCFSSGIFTAEKLIMLLALSIVKSKENSTLFVATTSATTIMTSMSTDAESSNYKEGSKEGGIRIGDCGKYFFSYNRFKTVFLKPDQEPSKRDNNINCYGYILSKSNLIRPEELDL